MSSLNQVTLQGNLGADPELRFTPSGQPVCNFRIATSEHWLDKKTGEKQERTEWHRITVWGKQAENAGQFLVKGQQVTIVGKLQTRSYEDREGIKRYVTEIQANQVVYGSKPRGSAQGQLPLESLSSAPVGTDDAPQVTDDDVPF